MHPFLRPYLSVANALLVLIILPSVTQTVTAQNGPAVSGLQNVTAQNAVRTLSTGSPTARKLSFADRVTFQRAIENVYWRHRIWPNAGPKPALDKIMSTAQTEKKVEDYLRYSILVEDELHRSITPQQLQDEMERMASHTRQPELLRELFAVLGHDPFVIAECLARPILVQRLVTESPAAIQVSNVPLGNAGTGSSAARGGSPHPLLWITRLPKD